MPKTIEIDGVVYNLTPAETRTTPNTPKTARYTLGVDFTPIGTPNILFKQLIEGKFETISRYDISIEVEVIVGDTAVYLMEGTMPNCNCPIQRTLAIIHPDKTVTTIKL